MQTKMMKDSAELEFMEYEFKLINDNVVWKACSNNVNLDAWNVSIIFLQVVLIYPFF